MVLTLHNHPPTSPPLYLKLLQYLVTRRSSVHPSLLNPRLIGWEVRHTLGTLPLQHSSETHWYTNTDSLSTNRLQVQGHRSSSSTETLTVAWQRSGQEWAVSGENCGSVTSGTDRLSDRESESEELLELLPVQLHRKPPGDIPPHGSLLSIHRETPSPWLTRPPLHIKYSNNVGIPAAINIFKCSCNVKLKTNPLRLGVDQINSKW